jgi:staphylococcal nuclease domain-containing protein 1
LIYIKKRKKKQKMASPISYANRASGLDKQQAMPLQNRPMQAQPRPVASAVKPPQQHSSASPTSQILNKPNVQSSPQAQQSPQQQHQPPLQKPTIPQQSVVSSQPSLSKEEQIAAATAAGVPFKIVKAPKKGYAMVKGVLSGDTIIVQSAAASGQIAPPEKTIILSGIVAPKFAKGKGQVDEPFAWESREFLRKRVIGQQIHFDIGHTHEESGRDYAVVSFNGSNLALDILANGWAKVKMGKDGNVSKSNEELYEAQKEAERQQRGLHQKNVKPEHHIRSVEYNVDARSFFDKYRNTPIRAVVDQIRDGSTLRVELLNGDEPNKHYMILLYLAGVQCPRTLLPLNVRKEQYEKKIKENPKSAASLTHPDDEQSEPFADEAAAFTELRLLHRDVQVVLQGVDKFGNFFGSIVFAKGNITLKLLELGYGKLVPWSAQLTNESEQMKHAEATARSTRARVWSLSDESLSDDASDDRNDYNAKVIQVISGDSILVVDNEDKEIKLRLASVVAPRMGVRGKPDEPYAQEAKEHLRSKLVGHKVKVINEYTRSAPSDNADQTPRQYVTVFQGKLNINESIVAAGLAEVSGHRMNEERSQFYDLYLSAENKAKEAGRGKWAKKAAAPVKVIDLTDKPRPDKRTKPTESTDADKPVDAANDENAAKARQLSAKVKQFLSFFQREKNITAVVEHVFSAGRYKLFVPKEHVMVSFSLAGVRTIGQKKVDGTPEPLYEQALQSVRSRILQHTVHIEVETVDKGDNFLGTLFVGKVNLAVSLVTDGFARLIEFSARKSPYARELFAAQVEAKTNRRGLWKDYVEPTPSEHKTETGMDDVEQESGESKDFVGVRVTEIVNANEFFIHFTDDKNVEAVENALRQFGETVSDDIYTPQRGSTQICAGQFNDGNWYRVRVEGMVSGDEYRVFFIDYGNHDVLDSSALRVLPTELQKIPAVAHRASLAGIQSPRSEDYSESAAFAFNDLVWGAELLAKVEFTDYNKVMHLTLVHAGGSQQGVTINKQLLRDGWARIIARPVGKVRGLIDELKEHEQFAKDNHYNIWEYGDISDDEGEDRGPNAPLSRRR